MSNGEGVEFRAIFELVKEKLPAIYERLIMDSTIEVNDQGTISFNEYQNTGNSADYLVSVRNAMHSLLNIFNLDKRPEESIWERKPAKQGKGAQLTRDAGYEVSNAERAVRTTIEVLSSYRLAASIDSEELYDELGDLKQMLRDLLSAQREMVQSTVKKSTPHRPAVHLNICGEGSESADAPFVPPPETHVSNPATKFWRPSRIEASSDDDNGPPVIPFRSR